MTLLLRNFFIGLALLFVLISCNQRQNTTGQNIVDSNSVIKTKNISLVKQALLSIKNGDLITRSDDDFESLSLQNFSKRDRTYSHSGITFFEDCNWYVYHCMAGPENPGAAIKRESFDSFVNPLRKTGFGIFRYSLSADEITNFHDLYKNYFINKLPFDKSFNLKNDDSMYCSEVIFKSLKKVTGNRIILPTSVIENFKPKIARLYARNALLKKFEYVGLDDLYLNSFCKEISRMSFK